MEDRVHTRVNAGCDDDMDMDIYEGILRRTRYVLMWEGTYLLKGLDNRKEIEVPAYQLLLAFGQESS